MGEDAKILCVFIEEDNHSLLVFQIGGDEDRDVRVSFLRAKGKSSLSETKLLETFSYELADST
jgi:hypothetical protein